MPTLDITRRRGDTYRIRISFEKEDGGALDLTDSSLVMTVSEEAAPDDITYQLFEIIGSVVAPGTNGVADFELTADDADNVGEFFYDVEITDSTGAVRTVLHGRFIFLQDITKSDEVFVWTPNETPADGTAFDVVADPGPQISKHYSVPDFTYETRDGRRVLRDNTVPFAAYDFANVRFGGTDFPRFGFRLPGWEFRLIGYVNRGLLQLQLSDAVSGFMWNRPAIDTRLGSVGAYHTGSIVGSDGLAISSDAPNLDTTGWPVAGWYEIGVRVLADWSIEFMVKEEADPDLWNDAFVGDSEVWASPYSQTGAAKPILTREHPENAASVVDIWKFEWRNL